MKIKILAIALLLQGGLSFSQTYCAVIWPEKAQHYVIDNRVNVRSGPGLSHKVIGQLNAGDRVIIINNTEKWIEEEGCLSPWYKIKVKKFPAICVDVISATSKSRVI
ncbi:MAG: SH3 domain-containing protein [Spirochaetales bacterium]|nr:SH3 domain-containing protein [Spirochaetales bacterium]